MTDLACGSRGGPYQLINSTLNLAASRDLATSQRSSAHFLLSKLFCGSLRTGYRPTSQYMGGRLTLGTAVAISGAAASPNMGSKTPDAAAAALLALLNVRLGYWAPTPSHGRWRSSSQDSGLFTRCANFCLKPTISPAIVISPMAGILTTLVCTHSSNEDAGT